MRRCYGLKAALAGLVLLAQVTVGWAEEAPDTEAAGTLTVRVVDQSTEKPVAGAEVSVEVWPREGSARAKHETDEQGQCAVSVPRPQPEVVRIKVAAEHFVPVTASWENREGGRQESIPERFVFPLEKGTSIGGVIRNEKRKPIRNVKVTLRAESGKGRIRGSLGNWFTRTDKKGKWRCDIAPATLGRLMVELEHRDYVNRTERIEASAPLLDDLRALDAVMVMTTGTTISGVVRDGEGQPIHRADVQVGPYDPNRQKRSLTDENGHFELKNCDEGSLHIGIQAPGKAPVLRELTSDDLAQPLEFTLAPGHTTRVRVVDSGGMPLEGVRVSLGNYQGYRSPFDINFTTGDDGVVTWDSAPADAVEYSFQQKGFAHLEEVALEADGEEHVVILPKPLRISGAVADKNTGEPIASFRVVPVLDWLHGGTPYIERGGSFEAKDGQYEWKTSRTDTGHYVRIEADGYVPAMSQMFKVVDTEEETVDFELEKGENFEGLVRGVSGRPLKGADVLLSTSMQHTYLAQGVLSREDGAWRVTTDKEGRFSFPAETEACLIAVLHDDGYAEAAGEAVRASGEIQIQPWGRIEGRLVRDGKPIVDYRIRMSPIRVQSSDVPSLYSQYYTQTDKEGAFSFDRVCPGPYSLSPHLGPWEESVLTSAENVPLVIEPGETAGVALGTAGRTVVGRVVLPPGVEREMDWTCGINYLVAMRDGIAVPEGIEGLGFDWRNPSWDSWNASREGRTYVQTLHKHFVRLNPDGTFRIDGVLNGDYQLALKVYDPPQGGG